MSVTGGATAEVAFAVTCTATTGAVGVVIVSTGQDLDADGYSASVDGGPDQPVAVNDTIVITGLAASDHTVAPWRRGRELRRRWSQLPRGERGRWCDG